MKDAFETLCDLRWPDGVECPWCGHRKVYRQWSRFGFKCASCRRQFTPTSGTIFKSRKMPFEQYVNAITAFPQCDGPHHMCRILECDYRTAFNIFHALKTTDGKLL